MIGYTDGTIQPYSYVTRAQAATMFFRVMSDADRAHYWSTTNAFTDVSTRNWFNNPISTIVATGLMQGMPNGTFQPHGYLTNAQLIALTARFMGLELDSDGSHFNDIAGHWAEAYINAVADLGLIDTGGRFNPNTPATRAQAAMMFTRMMNRFPVNAYEFSNAVHHWPDANDPRAWYYTYIKTATNSFYIEQLENGERWLSLANDLPWYRLEREGALPSDLRR